MTPFKPERILVSTDFSENAATAFPYASALARHYGCRVILVHVVHDPFEHLQSPVVSASMDTALMGATQKAQQQLHDVQIAGVSSDRLDRQIVCSSSAATGILEVAKNHDADCIVMATHGRGVLGQVILGSVAHRVLSHAPCPVLCVKSNETGMLDKDQHLDIRSILVAGGLGDEVCTAFDTALEWGDELGATVHYMDLTHPSMTPIFYPEGFVSVIESGESMEAAENRQQAFLKEALQKRVTAVHANADVINGNDIARYARANNIDVVVVQRTTWGNAIAGSDSSLRSLVHDIRCPLLVL